MLNLQAELKRIMIIQQLHNLTDDDYERLANHPKLTGLLAKLSVLSLDRQVLLEKLSKIISSIKERIGLSLDGLGDVVISKEAASLLDDLVDGNGLTKDSFNNLIARLHLVMEGEGVEYDFSKLNGLCENLLKELVESFWSGEFELKNCADKVRNVCRLIDGVHNFNAALGTYEETGTEYPPTSKLENIPEPDFTPVELEEPETDDFESVSGSEGKIFDGIKEMGASALKNLRNSMDALVKYLSPEDLKDFEDKATRVGDNNKKALDKMEDKTWEINSAAKEGITKLASEADSTGEMGKLVSSLNMVSDGTRVIDSLMAKVGSIVSSNKEVESKMSDAKKALTDLEKSTRDSTSGDESNKDVVAANKESVKEDIEKAKESIKELRETLGKTKKLLAGYIKAISGISPKIFVKPKEGDNE